MLVGRDAHENDELSSRTDESTWFHIKDFPGAHVLLLSGDGDAQDSQFCADIAVTYSSRKALVGRKFRVCSCPVRNVERGSRPGEACMDDGAASMLVGTVRCREALKTRCHSVEDEKTRGSKKSLRSSLQARFGGGLTRGPEDCSLPSVNEPEHSQRV